MLGAKVLDDAVDAGASPDDEGGEAKHRDEAVLDDEPDEGSSARARVPERGQVNDGREREADHRQAQCAHQRDEQTQVGEDDAQSDCGSEATGAL